MNSPVLVIFCFISIFLSIYLSKKTKLNTGLFAIAFSYVLGGFLMNMSANELISNFSVKILFLLMSISLFYGYASANGTLEALASRIIYHFRKYPAVLPFVLYVVCFLMGAFGAAAPVVCSLMAPVCFAISAQTGIHPIIMTVLIASGSGAGNCVPWSSAGAIICGILADTVFADQAVGLTMKICLNFFLGGLLNLLVIYFGFKGFRTAELTMEKPRDLTPKQLQTLIVILSALALLVVPGMVQIVAPNPVTKYLASHINLQLLSIIGAIVGGVLDLADSRMILKEHVPWSVMLTVCGISMLLGVASKAGAMDMVVEFLGGNVSTPLVCLTFVLIGGFLSFFTGGVTVVIPMLVPIAVSVFEARGGNLTLLASSAALGGLITAMSPFSTGGSLIAAAIPEKEDSGRLINLQLAITFVGWALFAVFAAVGLFGILD